MPPLPRERGLVGGARRGGWWRAEVRAVYGARAMARRLVSTSLALVSSALVAAACGGPGGSGADRDVVRAGLSAWCDSLGRVRAPGGTWDKLGDCKSFPTAASGAYLKLMGKCYEGRVKDGGDKAPDDQQLVTDCLDDVLFKMPVDDGTEREVLDARCERMERCEKVSRDECMTAVRGIQASSRASFTTIYNQGALSEVASCLRGSSCTDDEDAARDKCYQKVSGKMLYF